MAAVLTSYNGDIFLPLFSSTTNIRERLRIIAMPHETNLAFVTEPDVYLLDASGKKSG